MSTTWGGGHGALSRRTQIALAVIATILALGYLILTYDPGPTCMPTDPGQEVPDECLGGG